MKKRILIVEDDADISMIEEAYLSMAGYETVVRRDARTIEQDVAGGRFDLLLLDLMLPGRNGYEALKAVRDKTGIPMILVTARTESTDKILGFNVGADDYIAKPFDPAVLVARVNAAIRQYERLSSGNEEKSHILKVADLTIDSAGWKVWKGEKELHFPTKEFELLRFLASNPNIVFSKEQLYEKIWGVDYMSDSATIMVHVNRIREKIEDDARNPKIIETVRGAGYRLNVRKDGSGTKSG